MKLITKALAPVLKDAYTTSAETGVSHPDVEVKFFTPWAGATWYISEGHPVDAEGVPCAIDDAKDWHLYGFCDLGDPTFAELGYVMLSDLESLRGPAGLTVERDRYFDPKPIKDILSDYGRAA